MRSVVLALLLTLFQPAANASGIGLKKEAKPTIAGTYVIRAQLQTTTVSGPMNYGIFLVDSDGSIGDRVESASLRPEAVYLRPKAPRSVVAIVPGDAVPNQSHLALCMWKAPQEPTATQSNQLSLSFRYCRLFKVAPQLNPSLPSMATPSSVVAP